MSAAPANHSRYCAHAPEAAARRFALYPQGFQRAGARGLHRREQRAPDGDHAAHEQALQQSAQRDREGIDIRRHDHAEQEDEAARQRHAEAYAQRRAEHAQHYRLR